MDPPATREQPVARPAPPPSPVSSDGHGREQVPKADEQRKGKNSRRVLLEWGLLIFGALAIAIVIKTFLFQAFYIPSESMSPTLEVNDRVLVNKLSYRLHDVNRGDVVVFEAPDDQQANGVRDLVKRVIGLPGETVEISDGQVYVDGRLLDEPYLRQQGTTSPTGSFNGRCEPPAESTRCVVPADHYLVLGDNRAQSKDGRVFGPIDESDIVGRVFLRIWPLTELDTL